MVNQAEQPENTNVPAPETGNTTTDITSEFEGVDTFQDTSTPSETTDTPDVSEPAGEVKTPTADAAVTAEPAVSPDAPVPDPQVPQPNYQVDELQRRLTDMEQQTQQYQQQQYQAQLQQQADQYQQTLEQQGYLPEQAQQISQNWLAQTNQTVAQRQEYDRQLQYLQGQANAAEHFAAKYDLKMSDLNTLKQFDNPQSMEQAAKELKRVRGLEEELSTLKAGRVPSQNFDNSQSTPAASNDEDRLLERYNQGDRSQQAQAAARRAAGLG